MRERRRLKGPLVGEVRRSLSGVAMTAVPVAADLGLGRLAVRPLG